MAVELFTTGVYQIGYVEYADGYSESWAPEGCEVRRRFRCRWDERHQFCVDVLGWTEDKIDPGEVGVEGYATFIRHVPMADFVLDHLYAYSMSLASWQGVPLQDPVSGGLMINQRRPDGAMEGPAGEMDQGDGYAIYDVVFRRPPWGVYPDDAIGGLEVNRYVKKERKYAQEMLRLPGQTVKYGAEGDEGQPPGVAIDDAQAGHTIPEVITIPFGSTQWNYEQMWTLTPNDDVISAALGTVNDAEFDFYFKAETLLLLSAEAERMPHIVPHPLWKRKFTFVHRPSGWNKIFNRKQATTLKVVRTYDDTKGIYQTSDFNALFEGSE